MSSPKSAERGGGKRALFLGGAWQKLPVPWGCHLLSSCGWLDLHGNGQLSLPSFPENTKNVCVVFTGKKKMKALRSNASQCREENHTQSLSNKAIH